MNVNYEKRINKLIKHVCKTFGDTEKEAKAHLMENIKEEMGDEKDMGRSIEVMEQNVRDGLL